MSKEKTARAARFAAFMKEFPFIERYWKPTPKDIEYEKGIPEVQRVDLDLMDHVGCSSAWGITGQHYCGEVRFIFIADDGTELGEARPKDVLKESIKLLRPSTWSTHFTEGERVLEALQRLPDPDQIAYILQVGTYGYSFQNPAVIVHKIPKGWKFSDWINKIGELAEAELHTHIQQVDTV